nr:MAG TPA: hypothetical protein [Caudoviricetes sp.]
MKNQCFTLILLRKQLNSQIKLKKNIVCLKKTFNFVPKFTKYIIKHL